MSLRERSIPVFINPHELTFFTGSQITHKQLLTLYNPYDFPVKYQVYGNASDKYGVVEPKGTIAPRAYVDLLVRHQAPIPANCHMKDKFMITMLDATTNELLGKRCVCATLLPGERDSISIGEDPSHSYKPFEGLPTKDRVRINEPDPPVKLYSIFLSIVLIAALVLPTKCDEPHESYIPPYLHISVTVKIFIGYVLGILTMALFKPS